MGTFHFMLRFIVISLLWIAISLNLSHFSMADETSPTPAPASTSTYAKLRELEAAGAWAEAIEILKSQPSEDAAYFYNLGTLHLRGGEPGLAVTFLEKADHKEPHNPSTRLNLKIARENMEKRLGQDPDPASNWAESVADRVPIDEVRGALGMFGCVVILFWMRSYLRSRRLRQTLLQPAAVLSIFGLIITLSLYVMELYSARHPPACLLKKEVVRSGPSDRYLELGQVSTGTKVRVLGAGFSDSSPVEQWLQIRFTKSSVGWIRASSLLLF